MPTPPKRASLAPTPPVAPQKPSPGLVGASPALVQTQIPLPLSEPVQPQPEASATPQKLRIRTRHGYPIHVPHLGLRIMPGETVELDDHEWLRKQIQLGTFVSL